MADSNIEWTDKVWNPVRGCSLVSQGCKNCYAMRTAHRFNGPGQPYEGLTEVVNGHPVWTGKIHLAEDKLDEPLHWKKPARIFVNSMSDLFHEDVPFEFIDKVFAVMAHFQKHTFQILTKRPERMLEYCDSRNETMTTGEHISYVEPVPTWPLPNVWLGVSVEDQKTADERIPLLLKTPAAVRWVSYEPALGPVDFHKYFIVWPEGGFEYAYSRRNMINWLVCGGESGPGARPMHPDWARSVRDKCAAAGVPFFFKQWGVWMPAGGEKTERQRAAVDLAKQFDQRRHVWPDGTYSVMTDKHVAGRLLDGREWNEYPLAAAQAVAQ